MATTEVMNSPFAGVATDLDAYWDDFLKAMDESLAKVEDILEQTKGMQETCTDEWCLATEHVLDDIANWVFSISEPRYGVDEAKSAKLKELKRRIHDAYAKYKAVSGK